MKLSTFVAIAAVIGGSFLIAPSAEANCQRGRDGLDISGCTSSFLAGIDTRQNINYGSTNSTSSCPSGTSYHKIKTGGLLFKRTIAEGCYSSFEAAQLRMQADGMEQNRRSNVMRNINANRSRQCFGSATSFGNTTYGNATCY